MHRKTSSLLPSYRHKIAYFLHQLCCIISWWLMKMEQKYRVTIQSPNELYTDEWNEPPTSQPSHQPPHPLCSKFLWLGISPKDFCSLPLTRSPKQNVPKIYSCFIVREGENAGGELANGKLPGSYIISESWREPNGKRIITSNTTFSSYLVISKDL